MSRSFNRRRFIAATAAAGIGAVAAHGRSAKAAETAAPGKPAILGGEKTRKTPFSSWPLVEDNDREAMRATLDSAKWFRGWGKNVDKFEEAFAQLTGAKHCLATNSGTSALVATLGALGIGPGDEVIVTPYTFIASITSILMHYALPVFVDIDPETFQIDAKKIEAAVTPQTKAIMPVHIGGSCADLDTVLAVAKKRKLLVIEDACQAHLAEWRTAKAGTLGKAGCYSFQITKNLPSGDGGAIITNDGELVERLYAFHSNCRPKTLGSFNFTYFNTRAGNFRMTEFVGTVLLTQMTRVEKQSQARDANTKYLTSLLQQIPGIIPAKTYEGNTRSSHHIYMMRYKSEEFAGLSRDKFIEALKAEGIPCLSGYAPIDFRKFVQEALAPDGRLRVYSQKQMADWASRCQLPENDKLCKEAVWIMQENFIGPRSDMDQIAEAVRKIRAHAGEIVKAS